MLELPFSLTRISFPGFKKDLEPVCLAILIFPNWDYVPYEWRTSCHIHRRKLWQLYSMLLQYEDVLA